MVLLKLLLCAAIDVDFSDRTGATKMIEPSSFPLQKEIRENALIYMASPKHRDPVMLNADWTAKYDPAAENQISNPSQGCSFWGIVGAGWLYFKQTRFKGAKSSSK